LREKRGKVKEQKALFDQLKSPRRRERRAAARQLGELAEDPTAQALAYLVLEAPNLSLSRTAAQKLARLDARCAKACLLQDAVYKIPHSCFSYTQSNQQKGLTQ
jgi:HEAT repeat protein